MKLPTKSPKIPTYCMRQTMIMTGLGFILCALGTTDKIDKRNV